MAENASSIPMDISSGPVPVAAGGGGGKGQKRKVLQTLDPNSNTRQLRSKAGRDRDHRTNAPQQRKSAEEQSQGGASSAPLENDAASIPDAASAPSPAASDTASSAAEESPDSAPATVVLHEHDIDGADAGDQFAVSEYTADIFIHLRQAEASSAVSPTYMQRQTDINERMRSILNDWLIEVHLKFKLRPETLFLCFQLIDRFLQDNVVNRQRLQLVGVTGMMLASKYEEIYPPEVRDFVYICDNAYTREQILEMEALMLGRLGFRLSCPTAWSFLRRFCKAADRDGDRAFLNLASCVAEMAQIDYKMIKYPPSMLAASAVAVANKVMGSPAWTARLQHHCAYTEEHMAGCVADLSALLRNAPAETRYKAVYKKYAHPKFLEVALLDTAALAPAPP